jgi:hypothetical protein
MIIGLGEKRQFFRRKLSKITENCDHNIDPCFDLVSTQSCVDFSKSM